ncbi:MAG: Trm112 family protein [Anaerolineae bacterium]
MVSQELLDILRCPEAVHYTDKGDDPGTLELVHGCWLVCADSGYKYPIVNDIPVMLIDVGKRFHDVDVADLPVPPPDDVTSIS